MTLIAKITKFSMRNYKVKLSISVEYIYTIFVVLLLHLCTWAPQ